MNKTDAFLLICRNIFPNAMRAILFSTIVLPLFTVLVPFAQSQQLAQELPESVVIAGLWRSGEMVRYELDEVIHIYRDGELLEERTQSTLVHIDVAARRPGDSYILLWQVLETNAPLFNDAELDRHMYGFLNDGIVIHTDRFGGFNYSSNMDELHGHFQSAVRELDRQGYWEQSSELRQQLEAYYTDVSLFESLLLRDMKFMFGLHGVEVLPDDVFVYDTWQENPWGEPLTSQGRLFVEDYDEENMLLLVRNEVTMDEADIAESGISLKETQSYSIQAINGWLHEVRLDDEMIWDDFIRTRTLTIKKTDT
ncbi:MAG: hypothetical protein LAT84_00165 [Balneolia bacterium]|nr:hypothetical protein [Balneolia bacterium]